MRMVSRFLLNTLMAGWVASAAFAALAGTLSPAEQRFVARKDTMGAYAYQMTETLAYKFGSIDMPLGEAWRSAGSKAEHEAAEFIKQEMWDIGLSNVAKEGFPVHGYTFKGASVQVVSPTPGAIMLAGGMGGVIGTGRTDLSAELVYVGLGTKDDYLGKNVTGKIVLVEISTADMNWFHVPQYEAEFHGASGMIVRWIEFQPLADSIFSTNASARQTIPAVVVSDNDFAILRSFTEGPQPVTVSIRSDVKIDTSETSFNVVGYIPGTTHPDQLIILGAHYDKWWYGARDDSGGVAQMLAVAKAMVDSGYRPDRTIVFVAHGAEEYGWTNTNYDWAIGSWSVINRIHPDWAGRTLSFFNMDDLAGRFDDNTIFVRGTPESQAFRKNLIRVLDSYFEMTYPWSAYYKAASTEYSLPSTWVDEFSYAAAGIPVMSIFSATDPLTDFDEFHTQMDTMDLVSRDNLTMSAIANGLAIMRLDRSDILPYGLAVWGDDLKAHLEDKSLANMDIDVGPLYDQITAFQTKADRVRQLAKTNNNAAIIDDVNDKLLLAQEIIASGLISVGGYEQEMYPHEQYQNDGEALRKSISFLDNGNATKSAGVLRNIYGMWEGALISRPVYTEMVISRHDPARSDLFWATGRLAHFTDAYDEYVALQQNGGDYTVQLASLQAKYLIAQSNLNTSIVHITTVLSQATTLLDDAENLLD